MTPNQVTARRNAVLFLLFKGLFIFCGSRLAILIIGVILVVLLGGIGSGVCLGACASSLQDDRLVAVFWI